MKDRIKGNDEPMPKAKLLVLTLVLVVAIWLVSGNSHAEAACPTNFIYHTSTIVVGQVGSVDVEGRVRHRGIIITDPDWMWSCIHGQVVSDADSSIDQISWNGWKYEDGSRVDQWGSSCTDCSSGSSLGSHQSWFLWDLAPTIKVKGKHYFRYGASTLWLESVKTVNYG